MSSLLKATKFVRRSVAIITRQISSESQTDPSDDLNHVILLGTVNGVNKSSDPEKVFASISLRTRDIYRATKGYGMKVVSHRIQVFGPDLFQKAIQLNKGDRICVHGYLGAFPLDVSRRMWLHCVVARSICLYHNPPDEQDEQFYTGTSDTEMSETTGSTTAAV
ncbi:hypothetical protein FBUS_03771 [Fasciolopsis buskii]|uniref:Uncharacterized protein n=1 Tax=Fasciolopsis buskii TaxID=27845 RepID=A0A8E0RNQ7_9TREM|nr:hypothetical protein FBUS_03771 [Fasciolopsis buski]